MSHQYKCIAATNNNIGWGWIELTLCSSWKLPCMPIVYNPVLVPRCCPVFCCMKVIRLFGPPSLVQDNNCTPCTLIFLTRWLWVIKIKKAFDPLCTYIVVCCDQVNRAGNTDHAVTVCKGFVYSIVNSIYKQDCMIIKHDRHIFGEIHKVLVGFFSFLIMLFGCWLAGHVHSNHMVDTDLHCSTHPTLLKAPCTLYALSKCTKQKGYCQMLRGVVVHS